MKLYVVLVIILMLSGCAGKTGLPVEQWKEGSTPTKEIAHSTTSNRAIYIKQKYLSTPTAIVPSSEIPVGFGVSVSVHAPLKLTASGKGYGYCGPATQHTPGATASIFACFFDRDDDNRFEAVSWGLSEGSLEQRPRYSIDEEIVQGVGGYKYEITYLGAKKGSLHLKYKSYTDDMTEPKYLQDIEIPIDQKGKAFLTFKGLSIEFLSANEISATYLISGELDEALPTGTNVSEKRSPEADRVYHEALAEKERLERERIQAEEAARRSAKLRAEREKVEKEKAERELEEKRRSRQSRLARERRQEEASTGDPCKGEVSAAISLALALGYSDAKAYKAGQNAYEECRRVKGY